MKLQLCHLLPIIFYQKVPFYVFFNRYSFIFKTVLYTHSWFNHWKQHRNVRSSKHYHIVLLNLHLRLYICLEKSKITKSTELRLKFKTESPSWSLKYSVNDNNLILFFCIHRRPSKINRLRFGTFNDFNTKLNWSNDWKAVTACNRQK